MSTGSLFTGRVMEIEVCNNDQNKGDFFKLEKENSTMKKTQSRISSNYQLSSRSKIPIKIGTQSKDNDRDPCPKLVTTKRTIIDETGFPNEADLRHSDHQTVAIIPICNRSSSCAANFPDRLDTPLSPSSESKVNKWQDATSYTALMSPPNSPETDQCNNRNVGDVMAKYDHAGSPAPPSCTKERYNVVFGSMQRDQTPQEISVGRLAEEVEKSQEMQFQLVASKNKVDNPQDDDNVSFKISEQQVQVEKPQERIASFRPLPLPNTPTRPRGNFGLEAQSSNDVWQRNSSTSGSAIVQKKNKVALGGGGVRNLPGTTYESIFYRKKALSSGKATVALCPSRKTSNYVDANRSDQFHAHAEQRTVFTKIITETNYEYEDEESSVTKLSKGKAKGVTDANNKTKSKHRPQKVRIADDKPIKSSTCLDKGKRQDNRVKREKSKQAKSDLSNNTSGNIPSFSTSQLMVPGVLQENSEVEATKSKSCEKCKEYQNLLSQSHATLRYLTEMLTLNNAEKQGTQECGVNARETQNTTLSFDVDEFIRKYFRNRLYTKDFQDTPFTPLQLYHVAISARDCMAQVIKQKVKHAESLLKHKYNVLMAMKTSSGKPLDESLYIAVLDSYRRFIRYIYYYLKDSMKHIERFELACLSQQKTDANKPKCRMVYSHEQIVNINGERYTAVVIPIRKISDEKEPT